MASSMMLCARGSPVPHVRRKARIVFALSKSELGVCDVAALLGMTMSAVSHQLRFLRRLGLVKFRKEGRLVYYSLDDEHASGILTQVLEHVRHGRSRPNVRARGARKYQSSQQQEYGTRMELNRG